ncbi:3-carboxy-cis,cis-muconate cycloisomerase, partial [Streptosporangium algeriense]
ACARVSDGGGTLRETLLTDPEVALTPGEVDAALDPTGYLGSAEAFVDRALRAHTDRP